MACLTHPMVPQNNFVIQYIRVQEHIASPCDSPYTLYGESHGGVTVSATNVSNVCLSDVGIGFNQWVGGAYIRIRSAWTFGTENKGLEAHHEVIPVRTCSDVSVTWCDRWMCGSDRQTDRSNDFINELYGIEDEGITNRHHIPVP